jgi:hypothetical protein
VATDTTANGRQIALGADNADGIAQITFLQLVNPVGNIVADRTAFLALGHFAMQASLSLLDSLGHRVALVDLFFEFHTFLFDVK